MISHQNFKIMAKNPNMKVTKNDLKGLEVKINDFGEVEFNLNLEDVNHFLNQNLQDPKLKFMQDKLQE